MVVVQRLTKGVEGQKGERNKTIILWARGPYAFVGEPPPVIFFASHERNKIEIFVALGVEFIFSNPRGLTDMFCIGYIGQSHQRAAKWRSFALTFAVRCLRHEH